MKKRNYQDCNFPDDNLIVSGGPDVLTFEIIDDGNVSQFDMNVSDARILRKQLDTFIKESE